MWGGGTFPVARHALPRASEQGGGPCSWVPRGGAGVQRAAKCDVLGFFFPLSFKPIHES